MTRSGFAGWAHHSPFNGCMVRCSLSHEQLLFEKSKTNGESLQLLEGIYPDVSQYEPSSNNLDADIGRPGPQLCLDLLLV
jgi:hypothetical protein